MATKSDNAVTTYLAESVMHDFVTVVVPHYGLSKAATLETLVRDATLSIKDGQTKRKQLEAILNKLDAVQFALETQERRARIMSTIIWALALRDSATGIVQLTPEQVAALSAFGDMLAEQEG